MLVDELEKVLPGWIRKRAHWLNLARAVALTADAMIEGIYQARLAAMPGQTDAPMLGGFLSTDALPLIGRDRRIVRGLTETHADYALRLRRWRSSWRRAGTARGILEQLSGVLGPDAPRMRIVTASGRWYTLETDGTFIYNTAEGDGFTRSPEGVFTLNTGVAAPWDWDSLTVPDPPDKADPARIWIILYAPGNAPMTDDEGVFGDGTSYYGEEDMTEGTSVTSTWVELVRGLAGEWRAAGIRLSHIIVAFDPASFNPLLSAGLPDGYWGHHGKLDEDGGEYFWVPSRLATARYIRGIAGTGY